MALVTDTDQRVAVPYKASKRQKKKCSQKRFPSTVAFLVQAVENSYMETADSENMSCAVMLKLFVDIFIQTGCIPKEEYL